MSDPMSERPPSGERPPPDGRERFFAEAIAEVGRAEAKWPDDDILHRLAALMGEVGELAEGVLKKESLEALEVEAVQVAAMAYRAAKALRAAAPQSPDGTTVGRYQSVRHSGFCEGISAAAKLVDGESGQLRWLADKILALLAAAPGASPASSDHD